MSRAQSGTGQSRCPVCEQHVEYIGRHLSFGCPHLDHLGSIDDQEERPTPRDHLTTVKPTPGLLPDVDAGKREYYCKDCGARITLSPDTSREYGHRRGAKSQNEQCRHHIYGGEISAAGECGPK